LPTWDCVGGVVCVDPGTGQGTYTSLSACETNCNNTSVEDEATNNFNIYPNPNNGMFNISFTFETSNNISLNIYNSLGELVFEEYLNNYSGEYNNTIDLDSYGKGIYFITISSENRIINRKIIIQ